MKTYSWKVKTKKANIIIKKHTTEPDNCSRSDLRELRSLGGDCEDDRGTTAARTHAHRRTCTRTNTISTRAHAHTTHGTGRSAGATPRRLPRRGRPTPTAAAVQRTEVGARCLGLPASTTSVHTTPPLYPPANHTSPQGSRSSRSGKRAKWGEVKGSMGG